MASTSNARYSYSLIGNEPIPNVNNDNSCPHNGIMGKKLDKFLLLMWKNWLLQYRKPIQTIVEILAPVAFSVLLVVIRSIVDPELNESKIYEPFCVVPFYCPEENLGNSTIPQLNITNLQNVSLVYSPYSNKALRRSMDLLKQVFGNVIGYNNSDQLEAHFVNSGSVLTFAGIQLDDSLANKDDFPDNLEIIIRFPSELRTFVDLFGLNNWHTNLLYPVYQVPGPRSPENNTGAFPSYFGEGFLTLQFVMTYLFAMGGQLEITTFDEFREKLFSLLPPMVRMQRFPYSGWIEDPLLQALESFVGIIMMLSFVYTCINTVKVITAEKEKQLKEAMKIMGLPNWLHWSAWFIKTFVFLLVSIVLMVVLLKLSWYPSTNYSVFTHADPTVLLLFMILYICATITFCFAISVFFSKANTAATIAGLLWFLSYTPYLFMQQQYDQLSLSTKLLASLGSNTAMAYGFQLMLMYEGTSEGIQWANIGRPNTPDDSLTLGLIMMMLLLDTFIYLGIAIYVEAVFPGEYGVPLPWYFPFTASYWCGRPRSAEVEDFSTVPVNDSEFFETEPNLSAGVQINNLRKVFGNKAAVRNLCLNMFENQITVLLGHNGAGKTTTMSMLTGMFPPTGGTATINGYDIRTNMDGVRASLGLCPQHNILFDDLTVSEHLYFFSKLKGLKREAINEEIHKYIELLELEPKANARSSTLSGGMKRKLCVGMALCGNSKVVMLDEPTAGMDPSARRALWDLLQKQKEGRTMLLTTHFMDEADLLGDRIAIMAGGELQCCGSSFFLKKKYGAGYHLIMDKSAECRADEVTQLLRKHIPHIQVHSNIGSELTYLLAENQSSVFEEMLQDLEEHSYKMGIHSYGISLTTLEEVFMKVGADHGQEETYNGEVIQNETSKNSFWKRIQSKFGLNHKLETHSQETKLEVENTVLLSGSALIRNQFLAMLMKKSLSVVRTWILQCIQVFMPVAFLIIAIIVSRNMKKSADLPKLSLTLDSYKNPITLVEVDENNTHAQTYLDTLKSYDVRTVSNITAEMLKLTATVPSTARMRYIVGATFEQYNLIFPLITVWFNNDPYHSPPLALGYALNVIYKHIAGKNKSISFANYPFPYTADTKVNQLLVGNSMGFQLAFNIAFSMAFVSSFYVLFYVKERVCKSKHLQFVSGVKVYIFWLMSFFIDLLTFLVSIISIIITLACFQEEGFSSSGDLGRMFLLMLYFGVAMLPMMYFSAYLFEIPSTGYTRMTLFSVFTGVAAFLVVQVLATPGLDLEYVADTLHWIFLVVPHYSLATGIRDTYTTYATNKMCHFLVDTCVETRPDMTIDDCWYMACYNNASSLLSDYCCVREPDYFKWKSPGIGRNLVYSFTFGIVLFVILNLGEYKILSRLMYKVLERYNNKGPKENPDEDSDVQAEKQIIQNTPESQLQRDYILVLKDLTKYYNNFLAVNGLCLGVKQFECFGLLGVNGAGKTTTFKMMTGDVKMTCGDGWVQSFSMKTQIKSVQNLIGYCPQFDALLDDLTAQESLTMFALLRGVPLDECEYVAHKLAKDFDFTRHLHKQVKALSGGNKRKLSTAISLIGDPPVVYLDEPTTGMDPATKRYLWNALCRIRDNGKCVVLTSHSMEECEALCTRLAIMVNGHFKCLGSTQHLKNKFAAGYTLTIKIKKNQIDSYPDTGPIEEFIVEHFPKAVLREKHQELLTYYIVDTSLSWSKMFGILEKAKKQLNIEDYSLGQSSLEQVFLTFTKLQR